MIKTTATENCKWKVVAAYVHTHTPHTVIHTHKHTTKTTHTHYKNYRRTHTHHIKHIHTNHIHTHHPHTTKTTLTHTPHTHINHIHTHHTQKPHTHTKQTQKPHTHTPNKHRNHTHTHLQVGRHHAREPLAQGQQGMTTVGHKVAYYVGAGHNLDMPVGLHWLQHITMQVRVRHNDI